MKGMMEKWNIGIMGQGKETPFLKDPTFHCSNSLFWEVI
jgi:hypothetical protein